MARDVEGERLLEADDGPVLLLGPGLGQRLSVRRSARAAGRRPAAELARSSNAAARVAHHGRGRRDEPADARGRQVAGEEGPAVARLPGPGQRGRGRPRPVGSRSAAATVGHAVQRPQHVGHVGQRRARDRRRRPGRRRRRAAQSATTQPWSVRAVRPRWKSPWVRSTGSAQVRPPAALARASATPAGSSSRGVDRARTAASTSADPVGHRARTADRRPGRGPGACGRSWCRAPGPRERSPRRPPRADRPRRRGRAAR